MKEKNIKFIMELIFIFILPLLFILPNVSINNNYVYDDSGNFETSSKELIYSDIVYDSNYRNVILDFNLYNYDNALKANINNSGNIVFSNTEFLSSDFDNAFEINLSNTYYLHIDYDLVYNQWIYLYEYSNDKSFIRVNGISNNSILDFDSNTKYIILQINVGYNFNIEDIKLNINYSVAWANGNYVPFGDDLIIYSETDISGQNDIVYSPFKYIKDLIGYALRIDTSNITFNLIIDYTCIWFIMFIIWHLFYCLFDFIIHLIRIKRKE